MAVAENLEVMRRIDQAWNDRDWKTIDALHAQDVCVRFTAPGGVRGRDAHRKELQAFLAAFPDHRVQLPHLRLFGQGDWLCAVRRSRGTHTGTWRLPDGHVIPPTGRTLELEVVTVARVQNGQLVEETLTYDTLGAMTQLGLVELTVPGAPEEAPELPSPGSWSGGEVMPEPH